MTLTSSGEERIYADTVEITKAVLGRASQSTKLIPDEKQVAAPFCCHIHIYSFFKVQ